MVWFCFNFVPYGRLINSRYPAGQKEVLTWIAFSLEIYFLNHCHQFLLLSIKCLRGSCESHEFLKKSWNLHRNFPELEKVWKIEVKSGKMVIFIFIRGILLNQRIFFFQSSNKCLTSYFLSFWSNLIQSRAYIAVHREKSFVPVFFDVCIDRLFDNLGSRKYIYIYIYIYFFFFFFFFFLFSVRTPCLVGQSCSLYRSEGIRLEIIMSIEKNRFNCFYIWAQSCFHVLSLIH